uniref:DUF420 domain-containing protein n=1 Tax=Staphylococcus aureus TaxID=1280 RepID=UPI00215A4D2B
QQLNVISLLGSDKERFDDGKDYNNLDVFVVREGSGKQADNTTIGGVLGLVQIITAFKDKYNVHRKFGPFASVIWFCTAITGVAVYLLLYVLYPGGETTSLIKATFGH